MPVTSSRTLLRFRYADDPVMLEALGFPGSAVPA
jgi:hypothetical protein